MEIINNNNFQTNIIKPGIKTIAFSDIHGDIQSLIVCLRDCGNVIKKKIFFDPNSYDLDLETELDKDLNDQNLTYSNDLGYEWVGSDTHVVICGDMIDPNRTKLCKKSNGDDCTYYPQIELKILLFINDINSQASKFGGRIIKLMGNHELVNITSGEISENFIYKYSFPNDNRNLNYFRGVSRTNIFNVGEYGFKLLFEGGCGILVKINNYIFVHGGLGSKSFDYFNKFNKWLNSYSNVNEIENKTTAQLEWNEKISKSNINDSMENSPLWGRNLGDPSKMSMRLGNKDNLEDNLEIVSNDQNNFCSDLVKLFKIFKGDGRIIKENPSDLALVIGHCVQSDLSTQQNQLSYSNNLYNFGQTYVNLDKSRSNEQIEVYNEEIYTGPSIFDRTDKSKVFGISLECGTDLSTNPSTNPTNTNNTKPKLYRIDVGSSRGYDYFTGTDGKIKTPEDEIKFIYSKTPQILLIDPDNSVHIVKSKIKNTRIHLPRHIYESIVLDIDDLNISNPDNSHYKSKYLKYKEKYMKIKNQNNKKNKSK